MKRDFQDIDKNMPGYIDQVERKQMIFPLGYGASEEELDNLS